MTIGQRIKELRHRRGLSAVELGLRVGASKQTVYKYENDIITNIPYDTVIKLAQTLNVTPGYLMGWDEVPSGFDPLPALRTVPVIGEIACGVPALAEQNHIGTAAVPEGVSADFALIARGDSMTGARINNGDIVFIRRQPTVEQGQIAAVRIGSEATLKRVRFSGRQVVLWPENPAYEPIIVTEDMDMEIMGLAVCFYSQVV